MKNNNYVTPLVLILILSFSDLANAKDSKGPLPCITDKESITVFHGVSVFNRKKGAAKALTEIHQQHAAKGWSLQDIDLYVEDNDLEGFFITYTRDCNLKESSKSSSDK